MTKRTVTTQPALVTVRAGTRSVSPTRGRRKLPKDHRCTVGCYRETHAFGRIFSWCARFQWNGKKVVEKRPYLYKDRVHKLTRAQFKARMSE